MSRVLIELTATLQQKKIHEKSNSFKWWKIINTHKIKSRPLSLTNTKVLSLYSIRFFFYLHHFKMSQFVEIHILQDYSLKDSLEYEKPIQVVRPLSQLQPQRQQNNYVPELPRVSENCFYCLYWPDYKLTWLL